MVSCIADFYYIITKSEIDALALENNLIKKYKPKYNILLKDDKTYPYVRVTVSERYPAFSIARKLQKGSKYFGPYMGGVRVKDVLELVNMAFGVRICGTAIGDKPKKTLPQLPHPSLCRALRAPHNRRGVRQARTGGNALSER